MIMAIAYTSGYLASLCFAQILASQDLRYARNVKRHAGKT